ncbi:oxygen-independent coproporphyrinogen-III oxidase-like protein [Bacteroidaceae bacterium]|nr:oxygen-independent coproporphyrinogen-III oxidase-like protein [Bacteroidaceae bacterium]
MAGIYLHIPFCKKRCIYCDFFSTMRGEQKATYIRTLCRELADRKNYLEGEHIETIYLGGGYSLTIGKRRLRGNLFSYL